MKLLKTDPLKGMTIVVLTVVMPLSFLFSCGGDKNETIEYTFDPETSHTLKEKNVHTLISDSGFTRYKIIAETWLIYSKASEPYWYLPDGAYLERFDTLFNIEASAKADTVYYYERRKLWEMIKNVDISNFKGDRFETSHMFWDEKGGTFYSDSFILITKTDGSVQRGYGFSSNEDMTVYYIYNTSGKFPYEMRNRAASDSTAVDSIAVESMTVNPANTHPANGDSTNVNPTNDDPTNVNPTNDDPTGANPANANLTAVDPSPITSAILKTSASAHNKPDTIQKRE
jgi:hypothetical protein